MPALHCSELHCIIASHCMHCIAQVALKTVVADFSTFEIIKMQGNTKERAPMKAGPFGKIVADFPDGSETVDYANLMLEPKPVQKKKKKQKTNKTKKHVLKRPAVCKKPAAAAAAPATEDEEEGEEEEGEEDEEEEVDEDEWVPGAFEAPAALALPSAPVPLAAAPEDCFDCMQCN
jgi:hypothetical protein